MATLPDDIVYEILQYLPVTSLLRFKCVSKSWKTFISSDSFAKTHYSIQQTKLHHDDERVFVLSETSLIVTQQTIATNFATKGAGVIGFEIPLFNFQRFYYFPTIYNIVDSCHGLICAGSLSYGEIYVFNPTIRSCKKISMEISPYPIEGISGSLGFGYDSLSNDYKIVKINQSYQNTKSYQIWVYSLRKNSWKSLGHSTISLFDSIGTYASGNIHWRRQNAKGIVAFDLARENFKEIGIPNEFDEDFINLGAMGIHKDCLCIHILEHITSSISLVIWKMQEYGVEKSWTKLLILPFTMSTFNYICLSCKFFPLVAEDGTLLTLYDKNCLWNDSKQTLVKLEPRNFTKSSFFRAINFKQTLISPLSF
ncbi:hypothetical protein ACFE04_015529 [Oxalis oulophora]